MALNLKHLNHISYITIQYFQQLIGTMSQTKSDQMSKMSRSNSDYSLPGLGSASSTKIEIVKEYKSGAKYEGQVDGSRKAGKGVFTWPNGAKYEGEFVDNSRQGKGEDGYLC